MKRVYNRFTGILAIVLFSSLVSSCAPSYVAMRPVPPSYARPVQPGPGYIWVNDNWVRRGGQYVFVPGYWSAPRRNRVWTEGNWQSRGGRYHWTPGRWRSSGRRY
ncbi:MAG: YXWGXW repeat-containing protein [Williamsia sp.]|nr:YXWGXW repeat-containing protein [Williamsia sp.]